jgi:hypothetical protein
MRLTFEDDYGVEVGMLLDAAEVAAVKAARQTAVRSAGRIAVGRVGMLAGQRICVWRLGRQTWRGAYEPVREGEAEPPLSIARSYCYCFSPMILNSTRRFKARPASVLFVAIGMVFP